MNVKGLFNPKNATESALGMKEGLVRVDQCLYRVHQSKPAEGEPQRNPYLAMVWQVTRLDEDLNPMDAEGDGGPLVEEMVFSGGGKSLLSVHPGKADSPDDENIIDAGVEVNAEGPTVFLVNSSWRPHKKSGLVRLLTSLKELGTKEEWLDRCWAPDYVGAIFYMKSQESDDKMMRPDKNTGKLTEQSYTFKVVTEIRRGIGEGKKALVKGNKPVSAANGKDASSEVEAVIKPVMEQLSEVQSGQSVTKKGLRSYVNRVLAENQTNPKLMVPALDLLAKDDWLTANGPKYGFVFDPSTSSLSFV